jgi:hypothetical protein
MKLSRAAVMATGLFLAQQAQATSFVVLGSGPVANPRSVILVGEPALMLPTVDVPPPDRSIRTAALRLTDQPPRETATAVAPAATAGSDDAVAWPPVLSRSMVAFGMPLPAKPAARAPFSLPTVFRAGLAGDAFKSTPTPARAAVEEKPASEKAKKSPTEVTPEPEAPAVAGREETAPLKPRDRAPDPAAPPTVPATPPPTMRLE